ncbi:MAG: hypothetical protein ACRAVC_16315 [Trichormus sp.]
MCLPANIVQSDWGMGQGSREQGAGGRGAGEQGYLILNFELERGDLTIDQ